MAEWYANLKGKVVGPQSGKELLALAQAGKLKPSDRVRRGQDGKWVAAQNVKGLFPQADAVSRDTKPADEPVETQTPPEKPESGKPSWFSHHRLAFAGLLVLLLVAFAWIGYLLGNRGSDEGQSENGAAHVQDVESDVDQLKEEVADLSRARREEMEKTTPKVPTIPEEEEITPSPKPNAEEVSEVTKEPNLADLIEKVEPAVARIDVTAAAGAGLGSGFLVDSSVLVTNYHVIEGAEDARAKFNDGTTASILGFYAIVPEKDLAILKVALPTGTRRTVLKIVDEAPRKGEQVIALGTPRGLDFSASDGIVSGMRSDPQVSLVQTTAPISPGNSGGPLVNMGGEVVGINTLYSTAGAQNLNFAVFSGEIKPYLPNATDEAKPLASLPAPRRHGVAKAPLPEPPLDKPEPAPRIDAAAIRAAEARLSQLKSIYTQGQLATQRADYLKTHLSSVSRDLAVAQGEYNKLDALAAGTKQRAAPIQAEIARLQKDSQFVPDLRLRQQYESQIQQLSVQLSTLQRDYQILFANATKAASVITNLQGQITGINGELLKIARQQNQLRTEWLTIMDPFGKLERGEHEAAISTLSEWIVLDPNFPLAYLSRGYAFWQLGRSNEAVSDLTKAMQLDRETALVALTWRGAIYSEAGNAQQAMSDFANAFQINKAYWGTYYQRALAYRRNSEYLKAIADFKEAVRRNPSGPMVHKDYAWLMATCPNSAYRNGAKAVNSATKACELTNHQDADCLSVLAAAYAESGDFDEARRYVRQAIANASANARPIYESHLASYDSETPIRTK